MSNVLSPISTGWLEWLGGFINDWFFVFALAFLAFEFARYAAYKKMSWMLVGPPGWHPNPKNNPQSPAE
jgi:hypothetical protein